MVDLAGTAIGAVALGIQVCQGLVTYCRAVKRRNKDVDDVSRQIQSLESTFRALEVVIPRAALLQSTDQKAAASVLTCLDTCEEGVEDLQRLLKSIGPVGRGEFKGRMKNAGRKLAFGFRQGEVATLMQKVQGLTASAELALQTLTLDLGLNHGEQVATLGADMASKLSLVEAGMARNSTAVLTAVSTAHQDTRTELAVVSEGMASRIEALESLILSQNEQITRHVASQRSQTPGASLLPAPAILREACDVASTAQTPRRLGPVSSLRLRPPRKEPAYGFGY